MLVTTTSFEQVHVLVVHFRPASILDLDPEVRGDVVREGRSRDGALSRGEGGSGNEARRDGLEVQHVVDDFHRPVW